MSPTTASRTALPTTIRHIVCRQCRHLHGAISHPVPKPTPFVPDAPTFLKLIGRDLSKHESKIPSWQALFSLSGQQLRESGVEPAKARRYLMWWRERYRHGVYGIGGDLENVTNGTAELRIAHMTSSSSDEVRSVIFNPPASAVVMQEAQAEATDTEASSVDKAERRTPLTQAQAPLIHPDQARDYTGLRVMTAGKSQRPSGRGLEYIKGLQGVARLKVQEGLWEQKRGRKLDGGERRQAQVRAKRFAAARAATR